MRHRQSQATPAGIAEVCRSGELQSLEEILDEQPELVGSQNPHPWHRTYGGQLYRKSKVDRPVEVAAFYGHTHLIPVLLDRWLRARPGDPLVAAYCTALGVALRMNHESVLQALLDWTRSRLEVEPVSKLVEQATGLMHMAAEQCCVPLVQLLLELGACPDGFWKGSLFATEKEGWRPIHLATWYGWPLGGHPWDKHNRETVQALLSAGAKPSLWIAAGSGDLALAKQCVRDDPDSLHSFERNQKSAIRAPLGIASFHGHLEVVRWLLDLGSNPNGLEGADEPPVNFAVLNGHFAVAELLFERGASIEGGVGSAANTVDACYQSGNQRLAAIVLERGGQPTVFSHVRARNYEAVRELLESAPDNPDQNWMGVTTVFESVVAAAAWLGESRMFEMALDRWPERLEAEAVVRELRRALVSHNRDGNWEAYRCIVVRLLDHLASSGAPMQVSLGPILEYTIGEYYQPVFGEPLELEQTLELCKLLFERGAGINIRDQESGFTALSRAVSLAYPEIVEWLLANGAQPEVCGEGDFPYPVSIARKLGLWELERLLTAHG